VDKDELKIASLVAAFDAEHQRVQGLITQLEATSGQLKAAVAGAAHQAVTDALVKVKSQADSAAALSCARSGELAALRFPHPSAHAAPLGGLQARE